MDDRARLEYIMYNEHSLYRLKDSLIWLPDLFLALLCLMGAKKAFEIEH